MNAWEAIERRLRDLEIRVGNLETMVRARLKEEADAVRA